MARPRTMAADGAAAAERPPQRRYGPTTLFHLLTAGEWAVARSNGVLAPSSLDVVGFVHLSTLGQLEATVQRYYSGIPELVAVELSIADLSAELRYEVVAASGHQEFPHAYGPIATSAAAAVWPVAPSGALPGDLVARRAAVCEIDMPERLGVGDEREVMCTLLDRHRIGMVHKLWLLDEDQVRVALTAGGLTLLGLVRHLAYVERFWLKERLQGGVTPALWGVDDELDPDADLRVSGTDTIAIAVEHYLRAVDDMNAFLSTADWDVPATDTSVNVRWVVAHLLEETARHLGHADLLYEAATGLGVRS